jgi:hypothetical protein
MSRPPDDTRDTEPDELAALADGTLAGPRRTALEARVAGSPELAARLAEQERALVIVNAAAESVDAPAGLRARIEARRRPARRHRWALSAGIAVAAAAVILGVIAALPTGTSGPTVVEAAQLGSKPATQPAPPPDPTEAKLLDRSVDGVPFPNWDAKFGWLASGARGDRLSGRRTSTVYYDKKGKRIAYTIVSGEALENPTDARVVHRAGVVLRVFADGARTDVTWLRNGRTCVLSGVGVPAPTLVKLASWRGLGAVPF